MPPVGFEPTISAGERPQTYALDRAATGTGYPMIRTYKFGLVLLSDKRIKIFLEINSSLKTPNSISCGIRYYSDPVWLLRRHVVALLVETQRYKLEGRGSGSLCCHWNFSLI